MRRLGFTTLLIALGVACDNSSGPGMLLEVSPDSVQLTRGDTVRLLANALDGEGHLVTGVAVSFASVDSTIATVSNVGLVHAGTAIGRTRIVVRGGGAIAEVAVRVIPNPGSITIAPGDTTIGGGTTAQFRGGVIDQDGHTIPDVPVTWRSSDTNVATINQSGVATAKLANGTTAITARYGNFSNTAVLHVITHGIATEVAIVPRDTVIRSGQSVQLTATLRDAFGDPVAGPIRWVSLNQTVLSVSGNGLVQSLGPGGVGYIRASARHDTIEVLASVTVLDSIISGRTKVRNRAYAAAISPSDVAYVSQSDLALVLRLDLPSQTVADSVTVGSVPTEMAFNSTGTRLYVTNQSSGTISVVDVATNTVIDAIPVGNRPFEVIVEPGDSILWTGKIDSLYAVRLATKEIIARFQVGDVANGVAIAHDTLLYVSTHTTGTVVEINLKTRARGRTFSVGGVPQKLVTSPNGNELYIANQEGYIQFWDLVNGQQIGANLALPAAAYGLARRPSTGLLYATSAYFSGGYIFIIDPATRTLVYSTTVGGSPRHVVFTADGSMGLVPNEGGWVDFIK